MRKFILVLAALCTLAPAAAQKTNGTPSAETVAERMERAKRDAANPLRIIIEASQVKRTKAAEAAPAAPAPAAAPTAAARPAAETPRPAPVARAPAPRTESTAAARTPAANPAAPVAAGAPAPALPAPDEPTPAVATAPASAPTEPPADTAAITPPQLAAAPARAPQPEVVAPLKLVRYIEPEIPARVRARLRATNEVTVAFRVNADGSVGNVEILSTTAKALDTVVLEAVKQWRYDPVASPREHSVQLVFNLTE